jgi:hypothetical protein
MTQAEFRDGMSYPGYRLEPITLFAGRRRRRVLTHRRHEFLEAHQVQHAFEVVGQRRQAPFALNLRQSLEQKVRVTKPALDRPKGMLGQRLAQLELVRLRLHPRGHRFHQVFVGLPGDGPVGFVPGAAAFQGAGVAAAGPVVFELAPQFIGGEAIRQRPARRAHIDILGGVILELAFAIQPPRRVRAGVALGNVRVMPRSTHRLTSAALITRIRDHFGPG